MASDDSQDKTRPPRPTRRRRHGRVGIGMVATLTFAGLLFTLLILSVSGRTIPVPEFVRASIEDRVNAGLDGAPLSLGGMTFGVGRDGIPNLFLDNITFADLQGGAVAYLNRLGAALSPSQLLRGQVAASNLVLDGAQITVRRATDGSFAFRSDQLTSGDTQSLPDLLKRIDQILETGALASLQEVFAQGVVITLEDARSGRIWQATNANAVLRKSVDGLSLSVASDVFNGTDDIAAIQLSVSRSRGSGQVSLGFAMTDMPAGDIALQSPVLSFLGVLDAPISGSVRTAMDETGKLSTFAGTLDIAAGALQPARDVPRVEFESAKAYLTFDPDRQRIDFSEITIVSDDGNLTATGHSYLSELDNNWPKAFLGQFRVDAVDYAGGDLFEGPVALSGIHADLRLRLDPFVVELAQVVVEDDGGPLRASGRIEARDGGWQGMIDASSDWISSDRVLAFWPVRVSPITRTWLSRNLSGGKVLSPAAGVRFKTGQKTDISLSFEFEDGAARFLPDMPILNGAEGRATLVNRRFTLALLKGAIDDGVGGDIDLAGSVFTVPDVRPRPAQGVIDIVANGGLTGALSVLNNPPLRVMTRADRPVDIASASADISARISLPLKSKIDYRDVDYEVMASLRDVVSDTLVKDRVFDADTLVLTADKDVVGLDGAARLDGVPLTASWRQPLGVAARNGGLISGTVVLSQDAVDRFGLPLPQGLINGHGRGNYTLALPQGAPPELSLSSSLRGVTLSIPALGWTKSAREDAALNISATLGDVPTVQSMQLESAGLSLEGTLSFDANGFTGGDFARLRVGDWLDAPVKLTSQGGGAPPRIALTGGVFDLRRLDLGGAGNGSAGGSGGSPVDVQLDRLVVSDSITLAPVVGRLEQTARGLAGDFEGRVNGRSLIQASLAPANAGTAVRIRSSQAADVLRDAGLTPNAREGALDIVLTPVSGARPGTYDGEFLIEDIRLRKAPVMADLLDAISVVGLLNQLDGPGIHFETVDGKFRLTRQRLVLKEAAAVGGSIGISGDGIYDFARKQMDFRGVISPVYFLNGIGSVLTRRGEGLFGFNYRMTGAVESPNVRVNPLSIFTPGAFRQIFRRAPPGSE